MSWQTNFLCYYVVRGILPLGPKRVPVFHDHETKLDKELQASRRNTTPITDTSNPQLDELKSLLRTESADLPMRCGDGSKTTLKADEPRSYNANQLAERCLEVVPSILMQMRVLWEIKVGLLAKAQQWRSPSADINFPTRSSHTFDIRSMRTIHSSDTTIDGLDRWEINTAPNRREATAIRT